MEFGLTTPWNPRHDGTDEDQNPGGSPVILDRVYTDAGFPLDGSIDPVAVDALIGHANDYLADLMGKGVRSTDDFLMSPASVYAHEDNLKAVRAPTSVAPPVYDESQDPATSVSELVVTAPRLHSQGVGFAPPAARPSMSISDSGAKFIRDFEGLGPINKSNTATYEYPDAVKKPTIGWGHLLPKFGTYPQGISKTQAEDTFKADLQKYADLVKARVRVPLTQNQFDALTSLAYNAPAALNPKSGFLTALNRGDYAAAAAIIPQYNKARARASDPLKPLKGLTVRRNEEQDMFLNGTYNSDH